MFFQVSFYQTIWEVYLFLPSVGDCKCCWSLWIIEPFFEIAVIGPNAKSITDDITNYFTPNTIVVQSKIESEIPLFIDRYFEDETYIYVCQNKTCQRPETKINLALEQVPYIN